ncbi:hypothetical protein MYX04_11215 [Nitrospiraceae bacterium AH_259_D15_M11_P09]|nr:hypothetical protein [Nitrospiraceae bacterium AH_259_D15_M11_P09]
MGSYNKAGTWARKHTPPWAFNVYDVSERMGLSIRRVKFLLRKHQIPTGHIKRMVRLGNGELRKRTLRIITPSGLEMLLAAHAGLTVQSTIDDHAKRRA